MSASKEGVPAPDIAAVKHAARRGIVSVFVAQLGRFGCQFLVAVIMARLLSPAEFGITAMAYPLIAFLQLIADMGLSQVTIQRREISQEELSFMFWVSLGLNIVIGSVVIVCAPVAGAFYREPRVIEVLVALGLIIMLSGAYTQQAAILNRHLRFATIGAIDLGSYLIGAVAGIVAALAGWSYWAVVVAQGVTTISSLLLYWALCGWMPSLPARVRDARALLGFGGNVTAFNVLNYFARNLDNILIGRYAGETQLGLYDRAYRLLILPLSQVTTPLAKVATPLMARTLHAPEEYRSGYARMLGTSLLMTYPAVIFAGANRQDLIFTMLGPQWNETAPIFGILAIGAFFAPVSNSTGWLLTTQDRTREMRNFGAVSSLAFVLSFLIGLPGGALSVAACYIAVGCVQGPLLWWGTTRRGPVSTSFLAQLMLPYVVATIPAALGMGAVAAFAPRGAFTLVAALIGSYALFLAGLCLTSSGRVALDEIRKQIGRLLTGVTVKKIGVR